MVHLLYALTALLMIVLFAQNMQRGVLTGELRMELNEVRTSMIGAAIDVLDDIARDNVAFDNATREDNIPNDPDSLAIFFPRVQSTAQLTPEDAFGGCVDFDFCLDVDDYHGMILTRDMGEFTYDLSISVRYVDETNPETKTGYRTFAKEVAVTVSHPAILVGSDPLMVSIARVFAYNRRTS
jgi:hypothetical protein